MPSSFEGVKERQAVVENEVASDQQHGPQETPGARPFSRNNPTNGDQRAAQPNYASWIDYDRLHPFPPTGCETRRAPYRTGRNDTSQYRNGPDPTSPRRSRP